MTLVRISMAVAMSIFIFGSPGTGRAESRLDTSNGRILYATGDSLYFSEDCQDRSCYEFMTVTSDGSNLKRFNPDPAISNPIWSPSGKFVAYYLLRDGSFYLAIATSDGTKRTELTDDDPETMVGGRIHGYPAWSPNGRMLAYVADRGESYDEGCRTELRVVSLDRTTNYPITGGKSCLENPVWSPTGNRILYSSCNYCSDPLLFSMHTIRSEGTGHAELGWPSWDGQGAWSPDGKRILYLREGKTGFDGFTIRPDGTREKRIISERKDIAGFSWHPSGNKIAFSDAPRRSRTWSIYVIRRNGTKERRLTRRGIHVNGPLWSPDGRKILFHRWDFPAAPHLFVMRADGSNPKQLVKGRALAPGWQVLR